MSIIKDIELHELGTQKIEWVKRYMPVLSGIEQEFIKTKPFKGISIAMSIHLEAKTAYLAKVLAAGGAKVYATGSNPLSTQDDIAAALVNDGLEVFATYDCTDSEYNMYLEKALENHVDLILDDGGDLCALIHKDKQRASKIMGGAEETTTGIIRLKALAGRGELLYPVVSVNDADCKHLFDNRYGTGQSSWDGIMRTTNLIVAGKCVVVAGYGWVSRGIAAKASGLGANVVVTEIDPVKAIEAIMDGYRVMTMDEAAKIGDIFVTATGCSEVITQKHFDVMKDGVLLSNAGHFDVEVSVKDLEGNCVEKLPMRKNVMGYVQKDGRTLNLLGQGRLVNLAAGDGHPAEIMDMSFALQALSMKYVVENHKDLEPGVISVPKEIDEMVAKRKLEAMNIDIDELTQSQIDYLNA